MMNVIRLIFLLAKILPELVKLYNKFEQDMKTEDEKKQIEADKEAIRNAFENKDARALESIFNNRRLREQARATKT
jgi:predicted transcriptional regulator